MDSAGDLEEDESSPVGSLLDIKDEQTDPGVKEEVGCRNDGISNCIEICD